MPCKIAGLAVLLVAAGFAALACSAAFADDEVAGPRPEARRVFTTAVPADSGYTGMLSFDNLVAELARREVVILGEYHDDAASHRMELELLTRLYDARGGKLVLSMEMFERDVQPLLDAYLAGQLSEEEFLAQSRPWNNYPTDYRPLIEFAKANHVPVVAANTPTELARLIAHQGLDSALASLTPAQRGWLAASTSAPDDLYWLNFSAMMGGGGHGGMQMDEATVRAFYQSQCMKDDTMAESIVRALYGLPAALPQAASLAGPPPAGDKTKDGVLVLHVTGSFHCDYHLGTAARVIARLLTPLKASDSQANMERGIVTVALRPVAGFSEANPQNEELEPDEQNQSVTNGQPVPVADFVIYVPGPEFGQLNPAVPPTPKPEEAPDEGAMPPMPPAK